ncbi:hypothetical protein SYNTR_0687 [Candidatus Syntrophocurvum alkaliphilum]|uniref:Uncharacterized protein n=1 Tax=Candidatus Syntrophocurvum alkaliphilum TaxID=2293317 RepID=A0A6I6DFS5_9FIRM|nr:hypothetical protein [Candidatus Syntrophocurvum alkaliphilum]QGT99280.1 hypothetical protein SYNTR_0687 [Candidatus Syntrophocurvum alkaliphilum]
MIIASFLVYSIIFLTIFNYSYLKEKKENPNIPKKPISKAFWFPVSLALAFTIIVDAMKFFFIFNIIIFLVVGVVLYWLFNFYSKR